METNYQRGRIQEESLLYESRKHSGELPVVGVNTFLGSEGEQAGGEERDLRRATGEEKEGQLRNLELFHRRWQGEAPAALNSLRRCAESGENVFAELMETVKVASLGQISEALFQAGGRYRRSM
jgi:methylmalonyl-CoA mutase